MLHRQVTVRRRIVASGVLVIALCVAMWISWTAERLMPSRIGPYSTFRATDLIADNTIQVGSASAKIITYSGNPNSHVIAAKGSLAMDTTNAALYQGNGSNSWTLVAAGSGGGGAVTPSLSISQTVTTGTPNLTTQCTNDWLVYQSGTPSGYPVQYWRKMAGGHQIAFPEIIGAPAAIGTQIRTQAVTWTPSDNVSLGSAGAGWNTVILNYDSSAIGFGFSTSVPSSVVSRTFVIYVGNYNETVGAVCVAAMADGEASPVTASFTMTGTDNRAVSAVFTSAQSTRVTVSCTVTSNPAGVNFGWLAMCLE